MEQLGTANPAALSRRQLMGRMGKGVVAAGVVAWVTPEILIATPTAAGATSGPPQCQDKDGNGDDCDPNQGGDNGDNGGDGGDDGNGGDPNGGTNGDSSGYNPNGGGGNQTDNGANGTYTTPQYSAAGGSSSSLGPTLAAAQGSGGGLPLTGSNLAADAAVGSTLIGGGWLLTRWAAARRAKYLTDAGEADEAPPDN